jgi:hypothetical protein
MACPPHPYGIKPNGQAFLEACGDARGPGLGHMGALPDEVLLQLLYLLPASDLQRLGMASRALYAYCHFDELWKALLLEVGGACSAHGGGRCLAQQRQGGERAAGRSAWPGECVQSARHAG